MSEYIRVTALQTVPANSTGTGTVAAVNSINVAGTSTAFTTELGVGDFIADLTNNEVRRVEKIAADTLLYVDHPFTNLSGNLEYVKAQDARVLYMSIVDLGGSGATLNGETLPDTGLPVELGQPNPLQARKLMVRPVVVDGSSSDVGVTIQTVIN